MINGLNSVNVGTLWDWGFMWDGFGFILKIAAPFLMLIVAFYGVRMLLGMVVNAVANKKQ